jgi:2-C-methyl-D-erythritol 4-phosphate cytidylyltransferase
VDRKFLKNKNPKTHFVFGFFFFLVKYLPKITCRYMQKKISVILLCGGKGSRMGSSVPKQFLLLQNKIIALYSFDFFCQLDEVDEIIVVCEPTYRSFFKSDKILAFALPGERRQDSVYNGFNTITRKSNLICIHDSARPFLKKEDVKKAFEEAKTYGAAALGAKAKNTIKQCGDKNFVDKTLNRDKLLEIYTPQIISNTLLHDGFTYAKKNGLTVTDDVSLVELIGHKVKIVESSNENIKITTPFDLKIASAILNP